MFARYFFAAAVLGIVVLMARVMADGLPNRQWPGRGLEVDVTVAKVGVREVVAELEFVLGKHRLVKMGKGGYDQIHGTENTIGFEAHDGMTLVSISVDRRASVPIRVSTNSEEFSEAGSTLYDALKNALDRRWPTATREVP